MPYFIGVPLLLLLESTFVFTVLALLFHQRTNIGKSPFTMAFSALLLLTFLTMGADIQAHLWSGLFFSVMVTSIDCFPHYSKGPCFLL